jgi:hypothetical protein
MAVGSVMDILDRQIDEINAIRKAGDLDEIEHIIDHSLTGLGHVKTVFAAFKSTKTARTQPEAMELIRQFILHRTAGSAISAVARRFEPALRSRGVMNVSLSALSPPPCALKNDPEVRVALAFKALIDLGESLSGLYGSLPADIKQDIWLRIAQHSPDLPNEPPPLKTGSWNELPGIRQQLSDAAWARVYDVLGSIRQMTDVTPELAACA